MATWLSSKLKAAEQLLNQIDQQAADSLGKPESQPDLNPDFVHDSFLPDQNVANTSPPSTATAQVPAPAPGLQIDWGVPAIRGDKDDWTELLSSSDTKSLRTSSERKAINVKRYKALVQKKKVGGKESLNKEQAARLTRSKPEDAEKENGDGETTPQASAETTGSEANAHERLQSEEEALACQTTIEERQSFVRKLEQEKEALQSLVAEREEQQQKEACELRTSMIELIQAADLEKQRHSHTMMEALATESALQNESVELAKTLAAAQRKLDMEFAGLVDTRTKVEIKRISVAELERKVSKRQSVLPSSLDSDQEHFKSALSEEKEKVLYEIDYYKTQLKNLQGEIASTRFSQQMQSDRERDLGYRLVQLTDHLIQKQAEVEALSTEKATLYFRLETLSSQDNYNGKSIDVEAGLVELQGDMYSKVDGLFAEFARLLGVNRSARALVAVYFLLLHGWVVFVVLKQRMQG